MLAFASRSHPVSNSRPREFSRVRDDYSQHSANSNSRSHSAKSHIVAKFDQ
jgi:hypothetical protein